MLLIVYVVSCVSCAVWLMNSPREVRVPNELTHTLRVALNHNEAGLARQAGPAQA